MFKIGDFSKLTRVSIRMLRYYDEEGLFKPAYTDPLTGYRQYAMEQIPLLNKIVFLRDAGFSIAEISAAVLEGEAELLTRLHAKRQEVLSTIEAERQRVDRLTRAIRDVGKDTFTMHYDISIKSMPAYQVLSLRGILPDYFAEAGLWARMTAFVEKNRIQAQGATFALYHDQDHREHNVDVEICAEVAQTGENRDGFIFRRVEPVPLMAYTMVYGPFERIAGAYASFLHFLEQNGQYELLWPNRQIVHRGPWNEESPERYLTELQIPLQQKNTEFPA